MYEIYGKLPYDAVAGGRPTYMSTPLSRRALARYVDAVHQHGMAFNYLLNGACLGNQEWTGSFQKQLNKLLDWLSEIEVDTITVVLPFLELQGIFFTFTQKQLPVVFDSQAIPDSFLDRFKTDDCCDLDCARCGYCATIAEKAIRIDPDSLASVLPLYEEIGSVLVGGEFWRGAAAVPPAQG